MEINLGTVNKTIFFPIAIFLMEKVSRFPTWTFTFVTKFLPFHKVPKCGNF